MKKYKSKEVKTAIFNALNSEQRFNNVLQAVVDNIKCGNEPVVLESFSSYFCKSTPTDKLWKSIFTEEEIDKIAARYWDDRDIEIKSRGTLNAKSDKPFLDASITITFTNGKKKLLEKTVSAPEWLLNELVYFGYRDCNYFKLYFKMLGYSVAEGNVGDKRGLLISLGEE